jgi:hypothetical protein
MCIGLALDETPTETVETGVTRSSRTVAVDVQSKVGRKLSAMYSSMVVLLYSPGSLIESK